MLVEVSSIPPRTAKTGDGRAPDLSEPTIGELDEFVRSGFEIAEVTLDGRSPSQLYNCLRAHVPESVSVVKRGDRVFLRKGSR